MSERFSPTRKTFDVRQVRITPAIAEEWLGTNNLHNRATSRNDWLKYADDMSAGDWDENNGEAIKFSQSGILLDGQQRLFAIVESGVTLRLLVMRGLADAAQRTMDSGKKRSLAVQLSLAGYKNTSILGAVLLRAYLWSDRIENASNPGAELAESARTESKRTADDRRRYGAARYRNAPQANIRYMLRTGRRPSIAQLMRFLEGPEKELIIESARRASVTEELKHHRASLGFCYWLFARLDQLDADAFWNQAVNGIGVAETDPTRALRRALLGNKEREELRTALIIKAWNLWRDGVHTDRIVWRAGGAKPEPFPIPK